MPVPPPRPASTPAPSAPRPAAPADPEWREPVAPGVHIVPLSNGDVGLLVEFRDFLLAAEPSARLPILSDIPVDDRPGSSSVSEAFIERIKTIVPGKPIRYVVATHHHADHAGGVRAFFAEGATLLTTPANLPFFEAVVRAPARGVPDRFSRTNPRVNIEVVKGRRTITDGTQVVELIDAGPNPHTDEILVLYMPKSNILFQGDLFYYSGEQGFPDPNRRVIMTAFATWLRAHKLAPTRIYGTHMVGFATMEHVNRVLAIDSVSLRP